MEWIMSNGMERKGRAMEWKGRAMEIFGIEFFFLSERNGRYGYFYSI
jgi:hypothetical protein